MKINNEVLLLKTLANNNSSMSDDELAQVLDLKLNTVKATLGKMVKDRKVRRAGGGKFCLISKKIRK